jgi:DNA-3-methyladenine glycosylase I
MKGRTKRSAERPRCKWPRNPLAIAYHDREWGVPVRNDRRLFEALILEGAQAGLSWDTILAKRKRYREVFAGFDPRRVARFGARDKRRLMADPGIVRNRAKIDATVENARCFLEVKRQFGSFARYVWGFAGGRPKDASVALSKDLKRRGFNFVGPTIVYAFMQATGMVNDHERGCFRWKELHEKK